MLRRLGLGRTALAGLAAAGLATAGAVFLGASASSASGSGSHSTKPVPLDHFLCYAATAPNFATPQNVVLKNFLNPAAFSPTFAAVSLHCNPANKRVTTAAGTRTYTVKHPNAHLLCWTIAWHQAPQPVRLTNQFGTSAMIANSPTKLCVPSWKSKTGPPNKQPVAPPNLDHFTCYPLTLATTGYGFRPPGALKVEDEFSFPRFATVKVGTANLLCVPTTKSYQGVSYSPISPNDRSLVCFTVTKTPVWKIAYDQNQFGQAAVFPSSPPEDLCVPSAATLTTTG